MIHTRALPRPIRTGAAVVGVAATVALAGCASTAADAETAPTESAETTTTATPSATTEESPSAAPSPEAPTSTYADGTYTANGSYQTPESVEEITVTVTLAGDVVSGVEVTGNPTTSESRQYQSEFVGGIAEVVVGQDIDQLAVSRVAGSSLTSGGFNQAIEEIKAQAAA